MTLVEGLTILALFGGPICAVLLTRWVDSRRAKSKRKWEIFRSLMRYRRETISQDFVGALNLIEVEFYDDRAVVTAWKELYEKLHTIEPQEGEAKRRWLDDCDKLRATLLQKVAHSLGVSFDSLEMFQSGYSPIGWTSLEEENRIIRQLLTEFLSGERIIQVRDADRNNSNGSDQNDGSGIRF